VLARTAWFPNEIGIGLTKTVYTPVDTVAGIPQGIYGLVSKTGADIANVRANPSVNSMFDVGEDAFAAWSVAEGGFSLYRGVLAQTGARQFYNYYDGAFNPAKAGFESSSGRAYMTTYEPGDWLTKQGFYASFVRFTRTGRAAAYKQPNYFTTGITDPSAFGLTQAFPHAMTFWKAFGRQYHTGIGTSGFRLIPGQNTLLSTERILSTPEQIQQAWVGTSTEVGSDILGFGVFSSLTWALSPLPPNN